MSKKIYLAGPMSGIPEYNKPAFMAGAKRLENAGWEVFNPILSPVSRLAQEKKITGQEAYRQCLALDLKYICEEADAIFLLEGWENSAGALSEWATAKALGLIIMYQSTTNISVRT